MKQRALVLAAAVAIVAVTIAWLVPYEFAEYAFNLHGSRPTPGPQPAGEVQGRWFDDYFVVQNLDAATFAIGEPRYYQGNYSYLILGSQRAVLFDAGTGLRDILPVARSLTQLPLTVIASHLHFDHVGALGRADKTAVLDVDGLRARAHDSRLTLRRYEFLGFADRLARPSFKVDEWWAADSLIDLGGRRLRVLSTPGHTPSSVALYDAQRHQLFIGDYLYPGDLYAFLPGASRAAYHATATRLLALIDPSTQIFAAHMEEPPAPVRAPILGVADLHALELALTAIEQGRLESTGFFPREYPVRGTLRFVTGWPWNNR